MEGYVLALAPSGVSLGNAVVRLKDRLKADVADVEEEIKEDPKTEEALRRIDAPYAQPLNMESVTHNLPRSIIGGLWRDAVARCLSRLARSTKPVKILSGHLIYYSHKRSEFYSVINVPDFVAHGDQSFRPSFVVLLIDDIYDMYTRLSDLYSPIQIGPFFKRLKIDPDAAPRDLVVRVAMSWETRNLLHLLSWRHTEAILAENVASQLNARFLLWPVKQLASALVAAIIAEAKPIYLSHPITGAREQRKEMQDWPEFVTAVNKLQSDFLAHGISLAMPTAIDELRFETEENHYTANLGPRWPLQTDNQAELVYDKPLGIPGIDYRDLLAPRLWIPKERSLVPFSSKEYTEALKSEIDANCRLVAREIEAQISSRDFLFVHHTGVLVVFRPYYAKDPRADFSGGVRAEVRLWEDLVQLGLERYIAFLHFQGDVLRMMQAKSARVKAEFADAAWGMVSKVAKVPRAVVEGMVQTSGNITESEDILNRADVAQKDRKAIEAAFRNSWVESKTELLRKYLTDGVEVKPRWIGIWVLADDNALRSELPHVAEFLKTGSPRGNNWETQIATLFPDSALV